MRDLADYFVLDSLADDIESLAQIVPSVRASAEQLAADEPLAAFERDRVVSSLLRLIREGCVTLLEFDDAGDYLLERQEGVLPTGDLDQNWFRMTPKGRAVHEAWASQF